MPPPRSDEQLTAGLWWRRTREHAVVIVDDRGNHHTPAAGAGGHRPLLRIVFEEARARVELVMLGGRRHIDLTVQPGATARVLAAEALTAGYDGNAWCGAFEAALAREAADRGLWQRDDRAPRGLDALLGGLGFPMLAHSYDRGAGPLTTVPRWAARPLAQPSARDAASVAFGPRATRRTTRALAASLLPPPSAAAGSAVALSPLCLALVGRAVLEPDSIADVLGATEPWHAPPTWLTSTELAEAAHALTSFGSRAAARLLLDAAAHGNGPFALVETLTLYSQVRHDLAALPPGRLGALREACIAAAPAPRMHLPDPAGEETARAEPRGTADPDFTADVARRGGEESAADVVRRRLDDAGLLVHAPRENPPAREANPPRRENVPTRALNPPRTRSVTVPSRFPYPDRLHALERLDDDGVRLVLPRSRADLAAWGRRLHSCIGTYAAAIASGASWVIGVEDGGRLMACLELHPATRTIRQFLGAHNNPPPQYVVDATLRILRRGRVLAEPVPV